jgi:hypothetical protein
VVGGQRTRKLGGILGRDGAQVPLIRLVADEHDDDVAIGVVAELLQPPCNVLERAALADVIDKQGADSAAVVGRGDGAVPLLARRIPNLRLDGLAVDLDRARGELDTDGRLGIQVELIAREPAKQVGLADTRVADQDHYERGMCQLAISRAGRLRRAEVRGWERRDVYTMALG